VHSRKIYEQYTHIEPPRKGGPNFLEGGWGQPGHLFSTRGVFLNFALRPYEPLCRSWDPFRSEILGGGDTVPERVDGDFL